MKMKSAVVYLLLATTFVIFLTFSSTPNIGNGGELRLGRCLGCKHAPFDPLVEKMERLVKEEGWRNNDIKLEQHFDSPAFDWDTNPFSGVLEDPEEYFSEEGQLNITGRLEILFPWLDRSPQDGMLTLEELEAWNVRQATDRLVYQTQKKIMEHDMNGDNSISLSEYLPHISDVNDIGTHERTHGQAGWWNEQFVNADVDGNGLLNFTEFNDFLHPEESDNERIQLWLLKEKIQGMDYDKDGKLNFMEFHERAYDVYKNYIEFENDGNNVPNAEEKFVELDSNKDKYLTEDELKPITQHLNPGEISYAKYYTKFIFQQADDNRDGKLTLDEMLNHPYVFYSTVVQESELDDDDDDLHDEF